MKGTSLRDLRSGDKSSCSGEASGVAVAGFPLNMPVMVFINVFFFEGELGVESAPLLTAPSILSKELSATAAGSVVGGAGLASFRLGVV